MKSEELLLQEIRKFSGDRRRMAREIVRWKTAALAVAVASVILLLVAGLAKAEDIPAIKESDYTDITASNFWGIATNVAVSLSATNTLWRVSPAEEVRTWDLDREQAVGVYAALRNQFPDLFPALAGEGQTNIIAELSVQQRCYTNEQGAAESSAVWSGSGSGGSIVYSVPHSFPEALKDEPDTKTLISIRDKVHQLRFRWRGNWWRCEDVEVVERSAQTFRRKEEWVEIKEKGGRSE